MRFPDDFRLIDRSQCGRRGVQWVAQLPAGRVSVIGGPALTSLSDGLTTFEVWIPGEEDPTPGVTAEYINRRLSALTEKRELAVHLL